MRLSLALLVLFALPACGDSGLRTGSTTRFAPAGHDPVGLESTGDTADPGTPGSEDPGSEPTPGTTDPSTTEPEPDPEPALEACFPGADGSWTTCLPLVALSPVPADYDYPAPLDGSAQYAEPVHYLDLAAIDPTTALAPNFVLSEFAEAWKGQYGVVQPHAVANLQACRDAVGPIEVNSGYRNPSYNASIGGATWSRHMYGDGFDLDPSWVDLNGMADACWDAGAGFVSLYATHVHCDWRDDPLDIGFYGGARQALLDPARLPTHAAEVVWAGGLLEAPAEGFDEGEPLREWVALDAHGVALAVGEGETFAPPPGTAEVEVTVGGLLTVRNAL